MPDYLKELREAHAEGWKRLQNDDISRRQYSANSPGRSIGSAVAFGGQNGASVQNVFSTGYDAVNGVTVTPFILGVSVLAP